MAGLGDTKSGHKKKFFALLEHTLDQLRQRGLYQCDSCVEWHSDADIEDVSAYVQDIDALAKALYDCGGLMVCAVEAGFQRNTPEHQQVEALIGSLRHSILSHVTYLAEQAFGGRNSGPPPSRDMNGLSGCRMRRRKRGCM